MKKLLFACLWVVFAACGSDSSSGSGLTATKRLTALTGDEEQMLCGYDVEVENGPRTASCSDGTTVDVHGLADCLNDFDAISASCTATVADAESCFEALAKDECNPDISKCAALLQCAFDSGNARRR
jgi:hypothetical protein